MPRARDFGIRIGVLPTGPTNSVLDVAGVGLGHATVMRDEPAPPRAAARRARASPRCCWPRTPTPARCRPAEPCSTAPASAPASSPRASGARVETPVYLTSTMQLGRVYDAACEIALDAAPGGRRGRGDPGGRRVRRLLPQRLPADAGRPPTTCVAAHDAALGVARRGDATGRGRGRRRHRHVLPGLQGRHRHRRPGSPPTGHTVAVLLLTNFGERERADRRRRAGRAGCCRRHRPSRRSRPARASASSSPTRPSTAALRRGWPAGSGSGWRAPARSPTTAAARSSWPLRTGLRLDRDGGRTDGPRVAGRGLDAAFAAVVEAAEEAVLNSMLTAPTTVGRDGNTSEAPATPADVLALLRRPAVPALSRRSGSRCRDGVELAATLYLPDAAPGPQPCLLEALPYRKDDLTSSYAECYAALRDEHGYAVCRLDLRGTGSSAGDATDEYPRGRAGRPGRGDRLAGRAGLVQRQRRHVRHVVLRLQLAADRLRAAAGAEGDLRDLRQRRPLDRRRALARRRAEAGRPRRLLPLHDADVRAAARAGGVGRRAGARSGCAGSRPTSPGC